MTRAEEKALRQKLAKTLLTIVIIIVGGSILIGFYSPAVGAFFGFFSKHRNEKDSTTFIKPAAPIFSNVPKAVKDEKLTLSGYAQAGATVIIYVNGPETDKTTVGADGLFSFNNLPLIQGINTISAKVVDSNGTNSDNSAAYTVILDKEKPKITVDTPKDKETIRNLDKRVRVSGKVNEKATVKVNDRIAVLRPEDLTFEILLGATEGQMEIKIEATDDAGNTAEEKLTVKYVKGS